MGIVTLSFISNIHIILGFVGNEEEGCHKGILPVSAVSHTILKAVFHFLPVPKKQTSNETKQTVKVRVKEQRISPWSHGFS